MMAKKQTNGASAAVYLHPDSLTPWDKNPRNNDEAVGKVAKSIERFGFASPIIARKADGRVIAGHTRLRAALQLGLDEVPVRFMDLDDQSASALALADNRIGEVATWHDEELSSILTELEADGVNLDDLGFDEDDFARLTDEIIKDQAEPEVSFSEFLGESNNYIVLKFESDLDWLQAQSVFGLETTTSRRANGKPWSSGIGRVLDGSAVIKNLTGLDS